MTGSDTADATEARSLFVKWLLVSIVGGAIAGVGVFLVPIVGLGLFGMVLNIGHYPLLRKIVDQPLSWPVVSLVAWPLSWLLAVPVWFAVVESVSRTAETFTDPRVATHVGFWFALVTAGLAGGTLFGFFQCLAMGRRWPSLWSWARSTGIAGAAFSPFGWLFAWQGLLPVLANDPVRIGLEGVVTNAILVAVVPNSIGTAALLGGISGTLYGGVTGTTLARWMTRA